MIEKNIQLSKIIYHLEKRDLLLTSNTYQSYDSYPVKMRYEYDTHEKNKIINNYMFIKKWSDFHKMYNIINSEERHFYEMIGTKCKFFIDIDGGKIEDNMWKAHLDYIEENLKKFFETELDIKIRIIKCESIETRYEKKKSCHIIIPYYSFLIEDCKYLCEKFINEHINKKCIKNIIDTSVYGKNRCLRVALSSKINSDRIKIVNEKDYENSFISDIEDTKFVRILNKKEIKNKFEINKKSYHLNTKIKNDKYYDGSISNIINSINSEIDKNKKTFKLRKNGIIGSMLICDRLLPSYCRSCKRIHQNENPFLIVDSYKKKVRFYCRRSSIPTIYDIKPNDNEMIKPIVNISKNYQRYVMHYNIRYEKLFILKDNYFIIIVLPLNILLIYNPVKKNIFIEHEKIKTKKLMTLMVLTNIDSTITAFTKESNLIKYIK